MGTSDDYFASLKDKLTSRWMRLQAVFDAQSTADYAIDCKPGNIFAWVKCLRANQTHTCSDMFGAVGIAADDGAEFGATSMNSRIVIGYYDSTFELQLQRIRQLVVGDIRAFP